MDRPKKSLFLDNPDFDPKKGILVGRSVKKKNVFLVSFVMDFRIDFWWQRVDCIEENGCLVLY